MKHLKEKQEIINGKEYNKKIMKNEPRKKNV